MKKLSKITAGVVAAGLSAAGMVGAAAPAQASTGCTAVFVSPHSDDETLSMGASINNHVRARGASKVCVVLFTTGVNSGAKTHVKNGFVPAGTSTIVRRPGLTEAEFGASRDAEFRGAVADLGVPAANVYVDNLPDIRGGYFKRPRDVNTNDSTGMPTLQGEANYLIRSIYARWPNADVKTMSDHDVSPDHAALGNALREFAPAAKPGRYYVTPYRVTAHARASYPEAAQDANSVSRAGRQYGVVGTGRYSVGFLSVPWSFGAPATSTRYCAPTATTASQCKFFPKPAVLENPLFTTYKSFVHQ